MASAPGTLDTTSGENGVKAAIRKPALKLQSDERLAKLGPAGFETVTDRYRRPLTKHAAGIVGNEKADAVVDRAVHQARGLYRSDSRASAPGPWLYWMTHNLAVTALDDTNGSGSSNGHANGSGAVAAASIAANGSSNGHTNGATNGHVNGTNGATNGATNGNGGSAALSTLTYTEGAAQFTQDEETRKLAKGTRVRVRNGVGQLVPTPLLLAPKSQTGSGKPTGTRGTPSGSAGNRRTAIIFFGLCTLALIAAFALDRINNVDPDDIKVVGLDGQPTTTNPPTGVPVTPGAPPIGTTTTPPAGAPTTAAPPTGATTTPPPDGTSTAPGATPSTTPPATGSIPPASGTTAPAPITTTPTPTGSTPPASTTGAQQGGFAALLTALGASPTVAQANPLLTVMGFFGLTSSPATPKTPKTPKPAKLPKPTGTTPAPITPAPTNTTPAIAPAPTKPKATPLGNAGPTISYNAAKGQANDVTIRKAGNRYRISDSGVSTLPINSGCRSTGATSEICKTAGVDSFDIDLGDRDDVLDLSKVGKPVTIVGGKGDDTITGGGGKDNLDGGVGSDRLEGVNGNDTLTGGKGDDSLDGGKGNDILSGEAGNDSITGGPGTDSVEAGSGDDSIDVRDGKADRVTCGSGSDSVSADSIDVLSGDCESVSKS